MKKSLVVICSFIFILGGWGSNEFDITPYIIYDVDYPTITESKLDSMKIDVTFDYNQLEQDYVSSGQQYSDQIAQVIGGLKFEVNDTPEEEYTWSDSKYVIKPVNREELKDYNLTIARRIVLKTDSEQYQSLLKTYTDETEELQTYIDGEDDYSYQIGKLASKKLAELTSKAIPLEGDQYPIDSYQPEIEFYYNSTYFQYLQSTKSEDIPLYTMTDLDQEVVGENVIYYIFKQNLTINNIELEYTAYITDHMGNITTTEFSATSFSDELKDDATGSRIIYISDSSKANQSISNLIVKTGAVYTWFDPNTPVEDIVSYIQEFATTTNIPELQTKYESKNTQPTTANTDLTLYIRDLVNPIIGEFNSYAYTTIYAPNSIFYQYFKSALFEAIQNGSTSFLTDTEHADKYSELGSVQLDG